MNYESYLTWDDDKLEQEYIKQGFNSLTDFLLAKKKQETKVKEKPIKPIIKNDNKHKVKVSDIKAGSTVGFTKEGYSIIAYKKVQKGITSIFYTIQDPVRYIPHIRENFPSVKMMVDEINKILDVEKTKELAWW